MHPFKASQFIDHVIERLNGIIDLCRKNGYRHGYFAVLYKHMTEAVRDAIQKKQFQDNARMERLDVIFADRYLEAFYLFTSGRTSTQSWQKAFTAASNPDLVVFQHMLLGVNAHINLDLAIAAAQTSPGQSIFDLKKDFESINGIIAALTGNMQSRLSKVSWPMRFIKNILNGSDEAIIEFSITKARQASWAQATLLAQAAADESFNYIEILDRTVAGIASKIIQPGRFTRAFLTPVHLFEPNNVSGIIKILES